MALASYADLQTAVASWLNRTDMAAYIPDFIALAEERIYRTLRVKAMETAFTGTVAAGVVALPAVGRIRPSSIRMSVDLPDPLGPTSPITPDGGSSTVSRL